MAPRLKQMAGAAAVAPLALLARALDPPLRAVQRIAGQGGMITFFLVPNMAIFGIFVLLPLCINFVYSMTAGPELFLAQRDWVGGAQYAKLLGCEDYTRPATFRDWDVPEVLLSGNHQAIADWRLEQQIERTKERRPDLYEKWMGEEKGEG